MNVTTNSQHVKIPIEAINVFLTMDLFAYFSVPILFEQLLRKANPSKTF